jgi:hypothetical protein
VVPLSPEGARCRSFGAGSLTAVKNVVAPGANHYHFVLETMEPNLVAVMAWLQSPYTIRLNQHSGESPRASAEANAERIIAQELER